MWVRHVDVGRHYRVTLYSTISSADTEHKVKVTRFPVGWWSEGWRDETASGEKVKEAAT
jgi:hypothetical protein